MQSPFRPPLIGRGAELAGLADVLARVRRQPPTAHLLEVHGEPGIGKSRLLEELADAARRVGIRPVTGYATEYERDVPFRMFIDAVEALDPARTDDEARAAVAAVLPSGSPGPGTTGAERYRLYRTLWRLLVGADNSTASVLIFDDLHWADAESAELLEHLLCNPPPVPVLLALSYRTGRVPARLLGPLARTRMPRTILALAPLRRDETTAALPGVPPRRRDLIFSISRGNPLYVEVLRRLPEGTLTQLADPTLTGTAEIPDTLQSLLRAELGALGDDQREVVHSLAVAGEAAPLDIVVHLTGRPEADVSRVLDDLVDRGIVHAASSRFSFRHPLLRTVAYSQAGPAWRIRAHRAAQRYLDQRGGPLAMRAHHQCSAAEYGDAAAVTMLVSAAAASLDTSPATTTRWLRAALRVLPEQADTVAQRVDILLLLARALAVGGDLDASRTILHEVLSLPTPRRGEAAFHCVIAGRLLGRLAESAALAEAILAAEQSMGEQNRGRLLAELAAVQVLRGDLAACRRHAGEVVDIGRRTHDDTQVASGLVLLALAALQDGDTADARVRLDAAAGSVDAITDNDLRDRLALLPTLVWSETFLERYDDGMRHCRRGVDIARATGRSHVLPYLHIAATTLHERAGRLEQAGRAADDAVEMSRLMGSAETLAMALAAGLPAALWTYGPERALDLAADLLRAGRPASGWWVENVAAAVATVELCAGRPDAALGHLTGHLGPALTGVSAANAPRLWATMARVQSALGAARDAGEHAGRAVGTATALDLPYQLGVAYAGRAEVRVSGGDPAAADDARTAMHWFRQAHAPLDVAMARHILARALADSGDLIAARAELDVVKSAYAAAGAQWLTGAVTREQTRLGARMPRSRSSRERSSGGRDPVGGDAPGILSGRELEIARLAAAGLTNQQIAERLFISVKTVETHLSHAFTKLGVTSRVMLVGRLR